MSSHLFNKELLFALVVWCSFKHFTGIFLNYEIILRSKNGGDQPPYKNSGGGVCFTPTVCAHA